MNIVLITSKDNPYANVAIGRLLQSSVLKNHRIAIWEQDLIVPNETKVSGLVKYIRVSGLWYVGWEVIKQYVFYAARLIARVRRDRLSLWYPFHKITQIPFEHTVVSGMRTDRVFEKLKRLKPDLIVSILSKEILPRRVLRLARFGAVNLHPAFLPYYRGVSPVFWYMAMGKHHPGATLHYMDEGIDTGAIIRQVKVASNGCSTEHSLYLRCTVAGVRLVTNFLQEFLLRPTMPISGKPKSQKGTYYSLPTKAAVVQFRRRGYTIFALREFFGRGE